MALWTPDKITTALWLDAADADTITLNGSNVSQWDDKSGNSRHATQGSSTAQPAYVTGGSNGLNTIRFDGTNDLLTSPQSINIQSAQTFVVGKTISGAIGIVQRRSTSSSNDRYYMGGNIGYYVGSTAVSVNVTADLAIHCLRSLSNAQAAWTNGTANGSGTDSNTFTHTTFPIGGGTNGKNVFGNVEVCEVLHFSTPVDDTTRQKTEGYLAHKWGLAANLPAEHPYKDAAPIIPSLFGTITDKDGNPAERRITVLDSAGHCVATDTSDPVTGAYSIEMPNDDPYTLVFDGEPDRNAQVFANVIPGEPPA